jgi:hypothetical protein
MTHLLIYAVGFFAGMLPLNDDALKADQVFCDHLNNVYLLESNRLVKYNPNMEFYAAYDCQERMITSVDVSDPLRILVYFASAGEIVFLDKQMSPIGDPVNLDQLGYYDVPTVCSASRGGFWLFDSQARQIVHIDQYSEPGLTTPVVDQFSGLPEQLKEHNSKMYLGFPGKAILVFNAMGAYQKTLPFPYRQKFVLIDNFLVFLKDRSLMAYNLNLALESLLVPEVDEWDDYSLNKENLLFLEDGKLSSRQLENTPF